MTTVDGQDSLLHTNKTEIITPDSVESKDPFNSDPSVSRSNQQLVLPTTVNTRLLGSLFYFTEPSSVSFISPPSASVTVTAIIRDTYGRPIMAQPDKSVYIGIQNINQISDLTQWPTAAVGGGNYPVYFNDSDYGYTDNVNSVCRITCRNNTGADQQVLVVVRWRVFPQPGGTSNGSNQSVAS